MRLLELLGVHDPAAADGGGTFTHEMGITLSEHGVAWAAWSSGSLAFAARSAFGATPPCSRSTIRRKALEGVAYRRTIGTHVFCEYVRPICAASPS